MQKWIYKGKIKKEVSKPVKSLKEAEKIIIISKPSSKKSWFDIKKLKK